MRIRESLVALVVLVFAFLLAACGQGAGGDPMAHARITECPGGMDFWARVTVTNEGGGTADYEVVVAYVGESGNQRDTSVARFRALTAGQSSTKTVGGSNFGAGSHDCVVADVVRISR